MNRKPNEYLYTYSGQVLYPGEIAPANIKLIDIGYGLAGINRYMGQTRISVLRHSLALGRRFMHNENQALYALLHDAAEVYMMDIPQPMKRFMTHEWYDLYADTEALIFAKYGVKATYEEMIEVAAEDKHMVEYEMDSREAYERGSQIKFPGKHLFSMQDNYDFDVAYYYREVSRPVTDEGLIPIFLGLVRGLSKPITDACGVTIDSIDVEADE